MLYFYGLPFVVGLPLLLLHYFLSTIVFSFVFVQASMCIRNHVNIFCSCLFCFPLFGSVRNRYRPILAQSEQVLFLRNYTEYCFLFVVLLGLPLLQHVVVAKFTRTQELCGVAAAVTIYVCCFPTACRLSWNCRCCCKYMNKYVGPMV